MYISPDDGSVYIVLFGQAEGETVGVAELAMDELETGAVTGGELDPGDEDCDELDPDDVVP